MKIKLEEVVNSRGKSYSMLLKWKGVEERAEGEDINLAETILPILSAYSIWEDYPDEINPQKLYGDIFLSQIVESSYILRISPVEFLNLLVRYSRQEDKRRTVWEGDIVV